MRITVRQPDLHAALGTVARAAPGKTTLPILQNVLVEHAADGLAAAATNLDLALRATCPAVLAPELGEEDAGLTLPAKLLADLVAGLPGAAEIQLDLDLAKHRATVTSGELKVTLAGIQADDFPPIPAPEGEPLALDAATLKAMLGRVVHAAATDESRPVLHGVLWRLDGGTLTLAAVDGYRLAVQQAAVESERSLTLIVPGPNCAELARLLPDSGAVEIAVNKQAQIVVTFGRVRFASRLIGGQFPDYARIVPTDFPTVVRVRAAELAAAAKLAQAVAGTRETPFRLALDPDDGAIARAGAGEHRYEQRLDAEVDGAALSIALQAGYLRAAVDALGADELLLKIAGTASPALLVDAADEARGCEVVMPLNPAVVNRPSSNGAAAEPAVVGA